MANYFRIKRDLDDFFRANNTTVHIYSDYEPEEFSDDFEVPFAVVRNSSYFSKYDVEHDEYGDVISESYLKEIDDSDLEKYEDMVNRLTPQTIANIVSQNYENDGRQDNLSTDELLSKAYTLCADKDYGISPSHMENLSRESDWQNIESWYEGKDIYVSYNDDKISIDMLNTGSESPQNSVKVVIDGRLLDKRAMTLYETPNSPHSAEWVPDEFNTALGYANKVLIENNIKQTPTHENKDIYAVQYGRNNDKVFVYNMEHDSKNLQKVRSMTQSWQNAKVIPLVENGVPTKEDVMANLESEASIQTALTTDDFKDFTTNLEL